MVSWSNPFTVRYRGDDVLPSAVDFSGALRRVHAAGNYEVWHKASGTYWRSLLEPRATAPAEYKLVTRMPVDGDIARVAIISESEAGRQWRAVKAAMIAECDRLAAEMTTGG